MKSFYARALAAVLALTLVGCGEGGIQSPQFTPELVEIVVTPASASVALGESVQYSAIGRFTTPPGSAQPTVDQRLDKVTWSLSDTARASIGSGGRATTKAQTAGTALVVTAARDGVSGTATLTIGPPRLTQLVVTPAQASIALGTTQAYRALGIYTNSPDPQELAGGTVVSWNSQHPAVATVSPAQGLQTVATSQATGVAAIVATTPNPQGGTLSANASLSVGSAMLEGLMRLEPPLATVAIDNTAHFQAIGRFSDGTEQPLADSQINWSSADTAIAEIAPSTGVATGKTRGSTVITGALKAGVPSNTANRSAAGTLNVTFKGCTVPLRASNGATVASEVDDTCLLCNVENAGQIIDGDDANFASLQVSVGLLLGEVSVTVSAPPGQSFNKDESAAFVIGRPVGQLISAEIASQLSISTLLGGQPTGDSSGPMTPLAIGLLGTAVMGDYSADTALLLLKTTKPYDAMRLTFSSGLLTALTDVDVFAACGDAVEPAP